MLSKVLCFNHSINIKIAEPWSNGQLSCFLGLEVFCWLEPHVPLIGVSSQTSEIIKRSCKSFCLTVYANKAQSAQLPVIELLCSLRNKTRILRIKFTIILRFKDFCWVYQKGMISMSCTMHTPPPQWPPVPSTAWCRPWQPPPTITPQWRSAATWPQVQHCKTSPTRLLHMSLLVPQILIGEVVQSRRRPLLLVESDY